MTPISKIAMPPRMIGMEIPARGRAMHRRIAEATRSVMAAPVATPAASESVQGLLVSLTTSATASIGSSYFFSISFTLGESMRSVPSLIPWAFNVRD